MNRVYYKILLLLIFFIFIFLISNGFEVKAKRMPNLLENIIITIDPGHGGRDPGTRYGNLLEKDLNLKISKTLKDQLEEDGAKVYLLRDDDVDFSEESDYLKKRSDLRRRINYIESKKSDIYLSVHLNWYSDYYYGGSEVLYSNINPLNYRLALNLTEALSDANIRTREVKKTNLFLYNHTNTVGVLMECGFLSNADDRYLLQKADYQKKFSIAISNGIINYIRNL